MAIYSPEIYLTSDDRELLFLLASLLAEQHAGLKSANHPPESAQLSEAESARLLVLLEQFVESRKFVEGQYFIESLVGAHPDERGAREIYLGWRTRYGKTRAVASVQWNNFLARLGLRSPALGGPAFWYRPSALPMDFTYFVQMERKLAVAANLSPRIIDLVVAFVEARAKAIDAVRAGEVFVEKGVVGSGPKGLLNELRTSRSNRLGANPVSTQKLGAVLTIVLDCSTLFTTRDWSVTGFMSTIAGAIPAAIDPQ